MVEAAATKSPLRLALDRFWRSSGARFGVGVVVAMVLLGTYAPFIAGDVALLARVDGRWTAPVITDLFNRNSWPSPHDLLFNVLALLAPLFVVAWRLMPRRWAPSRRALVVGATLLAAWLLAMAPLARGRDGWDALWSRRAPSPATWRVWAATPAESREPAIFAPVPHRFDTPFRGAGLKPPLTRNEETGHRFWFGTDAIGRDLLAYMLFGARISLTIGLVATGLALAIGTIIGGVSGYFGGAVDLVLQRIVEIMLCFPVFILVLTIVAMTSRDIFIIMTVLGLTGWAETARLVRGEFLAQGAREYVLATEALGLPRLRIMFRHILPNAMTPLIITATFGVAGSVLTESGIAFIGLGDINAPSWGVLLNQGRENIDYAWLIYEPGLAIFLMVTALNLVGNGLREALDPKSTA